ncbi:MAG: cbb3-type cytochrome c oxidase subunit 3 [Bacteroidia bacterium]|jgi:cbb3-type cytochrome oxidase subunit 3|nr:cbb3-type cytochrome c oxidase subunit 3 [Bacteroidia bacterium]
MKIVTKVLEGVADIQIFPIIGLIIFFTLFVALIIHVARMSREEVEEYSHLPLEDDNDKSNVHDQ